jgi:N6-L-threonylcarbamoyladenine synthase
MTHADRGAGPITVSPPGFPKNTKGRMDFSFSGLKTAVARHVRRRQAADPGGLSQIELADICASFQRAVVDALLDRSFEAARRFDARSLGIAGGVSANSRLREVATARGAERGLPVLLPTLHLSTDNAAMIAAAGLRRFRAGVTASLDLNADAGLTL